MRFGTPDYEILLRAVLEKKRHDLYDVTCEAADAMSIHIYGTKPKKILERVRPREPEEIKNYRLETYEPTTKATGSRALSVLAKIFNNENYSIKWKNQTKKGKALEEFALENYPKHNSIVKFLSQAGLRKMIADPNGVFAVRLKEFPKSQTEEPLPEVKVFGSHAIWYYDNDHFLIHIKEEDEPRTSYRWHYFQYYDAQQYIDFHVRIVNARSIEIIEDGMYKHAFNEIPVWFLTGETETTDEGFEYYTSFFEPALPFWNKAINAESDLDAAFIMHLHPQKVIVGEECTYVDSVSNQRCDHGLIPNPNGKPSTCPACKGAGRIVPVGPYGVHVVSKEKLTEGQQLNAPVSYVTVPTEPTEMLSKRVDELHQKGLAALSMDVIDKVGEDQSGVAKTIDRGELYGFLSKVSDVLFDTHLQNFFYFFDKYMNGVKDLNPTMASKESLPEISKPVKFDLATGKELTLQYAESKKAAISPEILRQQQISIISREYSSEPDVKRKLIAALELDPLPELNAADMEVKMGNGTIQLKDAVIHDNISNFIDRAIREKKDAFWTMPMDKRVELLSSYADEFIKANRITLEDEQPEEPGEEPGRKVA